ncbi:MAG: hypothetical protein ACI9FJ_000613, partial [Alteromonadaceae bacterium]
FLDIAKDESKMSVNGVKSFCFRMTKAKRIRLVYENFSSRW